MLTVTMEYDDRKSAREDLDHLWSGVGLSGEVVLRPKGSRWYLEIVSEVEIPPNELDKLRGKRL